MSINYSTNEIKLFNHFGLNDLLQHVEPINLYRIAIDIVFRKNMTGIHVDALRNGYNAIIDCNPLRMTPEFELLIETDLDLENFCPSNPGTSDSQELNRTLHLLEYFQGRLQRQKAEAWLTKTKD